MKELTLKQYNKLSFYEQGYVSYWQGATNKLIPETFREDKRTKNYREWKRGQFQAMLDAQDSE